MSINTRQGVSLKISFAGLFALIAMSTPTPAVAHARDQECSFTVRPVAVCTISFYKLLATPKQYDKKYISVTGYVAISNGRLAVYPARLSYRLSIQQDSFSLRLSGYEMKKLADNLNRHYATIVGVFNYEIIGDGPGIGYISKLVDAHLVGPRPDIPEDHYLAAPPGGWTHATKFPP